MRWLILLALLLPVSVQAEDRMGRLFMTPAERSNLDYLRKSSKPPEKILPAGNEEPSAGVTEEAVVVAPPPVVTVQGFVKRSDGKGTVWVNRQPVQEKTATGEFAVGKLSSKGNRVDVKLTGSSKPISLKAGQTYDPASRLVVDDLRQLPEPTDLPPPPPAPQGKSPASTPATGQRQTP